MRFLYVLVIVTLLLGIIGCGVSGTTNVNGALLISLVVTPTSASLATGESQQFTAMGTYSDNTTQDLTNSVTWTSSDTSRANITNTGLATAVAEGAITVSASLGQLHGAASAAIATQNAALLSIIVLPGDASIAAATTQQFTAIGIYSGVTTTTRNITGSVVWSSSNADIAAISAGGLATGFTPGSASITATSGSISGNTTLTVTTAVLQSITVTPSNKIVAAGTPLQYTAVGTFSDRTMQDISTSVTWSSSDSQTASISNGGLARGIAAGTTTINASSGGVIGTAGLNVTDAGLLSIAVTPADTSLAVGSFQQFTASGIYSDGTTRNISSLVTWSTGSAGVAVILNTGLATGEAVGSTTVTARVGILSGATTLTVTLAQPAPAIPQWARVVTNNYWDVADIFYSGYDGSVYAAGNGSPLLVKYDSLGAVQWAKNPVAGASAGFGGVAVASDGSVYAAGSISSADPAYVFDFGSGVSTTATYTYGENSILVKYNNSGTPQWVRSVTAATDSSWFYLVTVAADGSLYVGGSIKNSGTFSFGNGITTAGTATSGWSGGNFRLGSNIVLVKYDSSGNAQWARSVTEGSGDSNFMSLTAAPDGSVYAVVSAVDGTYSFGNGVTVSTGFTHSGNVLVKYNSSGNAQWARTVDSDVVFACVRVASDGSVYVAGSIRGVNRFDFGNNVKVDGTSYAGNTAGVLVKYDTFGTALWARTVAQGSAGLDWSDFSSVTATPDGNVYVAGSISAESYDFGNNVIIRSLYGNTIVVKYNSSGTAQWVTPDTPGTASAAYRSISAASDGSLYVGGGLDGAGSFDFGNNVSATAGSILLKYQEP